MYIFIFNEYYIRLTLEHPKKKYNFLDWQYNVLMDWDRWCQRAFSVHLRLWSNKDPKLREGRTCSSVAARRPAEVNVRLGENLFILQPKDSTRCAFINRFSRSFLTAQLFSLLRRCRNVLPRRSPPEVSNYAQEEKVGTFKAVAIKDFKSTSVVEGKGTSVRTQMYTHTHTHTHVSAM